MAKLIGYFHIILAIARLKLADLVTLTVGLELDKDPDATAPRYTQAQLQTLATAAQTTPSGQHEEAPAEAAAVPPARRPRPSAERPAGLPRPWGPPNALGVPPRSGTIRCEAPSAAAGCWTAPQHTGRDRRRTGSSAAP